MSVEEEEAVEATWEHQQTPCDRCSHRMGQHKLTWDMWGADQDNVSAYAGECLFCACTGFTHVIQPR